MTLIKVKKITIERAEGPTHLCGKEQIAHSWEHADAILSQNAMTAPGVDGQEFGYDKHDFKVEFEDGSVHTGRYDLVHWKVRFPNLQKHCWENLNWLATNPRAKEVMGPSAITAAQEMLKVMDYGQGETISVAA